MEELLFEIAKQSPTIGILGYWVYSLQGEKKALTLEIINEVISEISGIPVCTVTTDEKSKLCNLKKNIAKKIVSQRQAINAVSNAILKARVGFKDSEKPIGVFLFLGRTGVGKTLLAKSLSEELFGSDKIIRLDMSEYMEKHTISKITGSPPAYVGYDDSVLICEAVKKKPYSVILLDEIEKAHKDVLNVFLQIFDEGKLTDSHGRKVDFRNTIIIMTSNLGTAGIDKQKTLGFQIQKDDVAQKNIDEFLRKKVQEYFNPEFINRIDQIVIFNKFNSEEIREVFEIEWSKTIKRIEENGYLVTISEKAKDFLCRKGYDEKYGARPMIRAISTYIETPLAEKIFSDEFQDNFVVSIGYDESSDSLKFNVGEKNGIATV